MDHCIPPMWIGNAIPNLKNSPANIRELILSKAFGSTNELDVFRSIGSINQVCLVMHRIQIRRVCIKCIL